MKFYRHLLVSGPRCTAQRSSFIIFIVVIIIIIIIHLQLCLRIDIGTIVEQLLDDLVVALGRSCLRRATLSGQSPLTVRLSCINFGF